MAVVTFTTDFGDSDHYVAAMKGVVLSIAPQAILVDVSHKIDRHDISRAAFLLRETAPWYPRGSVHLVVVDPGVGTRRRIIAARYGGQYVVAPDNGVVTLLHRHLSVDAVHVVQNPRLAMPHTSATFHGRDLMAPAAGHLAAGGKIADVGPPTDHLEVLQVSEPAISAKHTIAGQVIHVDAFGNLVTNVPEEQVRTSFAVLPAARVYLNGDVIGAVRHTYADVDANQPLALVGSSHLLEIAVNRGSAAERFGAGVGTKVEIR